MMYMFERKRWVFFFLIALFPIQKILTEQKQSETQEVIVAALRDYSPAVLGRIVALGVSGLIGYSQFPSKYSSYALGVISALPVYLFSGAAAHWAMTKLGFEMGVAHISPSQTSLKRDREAWMRVFLQIFHPKNIGQFLPLLGLELGFNDNYAVVDRGRLYRSAQYNDVVFERYIGDEKLACSLSLMNKVIEKASWQSLQKVACDHNARLVNIPLSGNEIYTSDNLKQLISVLHDENNYPMHVNCRHGKDRTGFFCALYLLECKGYDVEQAISEQLSYKEFGHFECHLPYICAILRKWHEIRFDQGYARDSDSLKQALDQYNAWYQVQIGC